LAGLERDGLPFAQLRERHSSARRLVKEVFLPVTGRDESESFVAHNPLDGPVRGCHAIVSSLSVDRL
jgi:hypothetical protein